MKLYNLIKPLLFSLDPESSHNLVSYIIKNHSYLVKSTYDNPKFRKNVCGMDFKNPIGLAAGFDKNAELINQIPNLGFGFMEVGTITPKPQTGNPKPRMIRLTEHQSLINSMGFNNDGLNTIVKRLESRKPSDFIIGANIGKNKSTPNLQAHLDYQTCFNSLQDVVDFITINISSPNTPTLRDLLRKDSLELILDTVQTQNIKRTKQKPVFLKISPDLTNDEVIRVSKTCQQYNIDGIVSTNTTSNHTYSFGGLSGKPLNVRSLQVSNLIKENTNLKVICSGGIVNKEIGIDRLNNFDLIQIYTGLVYQGPTFVKEILKSIK